MASLSIAPSPTFITALPEKSAIESLDAVLDAGGADEGNPLARLAFGVPLELFDDG